MTARSNEYRVHTVQLPEQERPFPVRVPRTSSTPPPLPVQPQNPDAAFQRLRALEEANPRAATIYRSFRPQFSIVVAVQKTEEALRSAELE